MTTVQYPGVYVQELPTRPPAVSDRPSAIPAFVGATERAVQPPTGRDCTLEPTPIRSLAEFEAVFGGAACDPITVRVTEDRATRALAVAGLTVPVPTHLLHHAVRLFFANGGTRCSIVSVGRHHDPVTLGDATTGLLAGLTCLATDDTPTLLVIPDAVRLAPAEFATLVQAMLRQCATRRDRFAILDVHRGAEALSPAEWRTERTHFDTAGRSFGAAYYPFLRTTVRPPIAIDASNVMVTLGGAPAVALGTLATTDRRLHDFVRARLDEQELVLPPSGAIAGVYAQVDARHGAWKAPANVTLRGAVAPVVSLSNRQQEAIHVDADTGVSINAIRAFAGKGTVVWGARTLAGLDAEWRYVPVRRFASLVEDAVRRATAFVVFESNDAGTWTRVRGLIEGYLHDHWRMGALAGNTTTEAYQVRCGVGHTMTAQDVVDGRLVIEIGLALLRPAEFLLVRIEHALSTT